MTLSRTVATAARVLTQVLRDHRSLALLLIAPSVLIGLFAWIFSDQPGAFDRFGPALLTLFPFVLMFVITSVTTLRERSSGTLERLMTTPMGRADLIAGYALAFSLAATVQAVITIALSVGVYGLDVSGPLWQLGLVGVVTGILGTTLGLLASAFARTEFQAVQFMPAVVFPQILLCGLLVPRDAMPAPLPAISHWLPLSHAVDAVNAVAGGLGGRQLWDPLMIVAAFACGAVAVAALTLRRRTA